MANSTSPSKEAEADRVLVFKQKDEKSLSQASAILRKAGFSAKECPGANKTTLLLVKGDSETFKTSGSQRREDIQAALPFQALRALPTPLIDNFTPRDAAHDPALAGAANNFGALVLGNATFTALEHNFGSQTAASFRLADSFIRWVFILALFQVILPSRTFSPFVTTGVLIWGALFVAKIRSSDPKNSEYVSLVGLNGTTPETRAKRQLLFLPVAFLLLVGVFVGLFLIFVMEIIFTQLYIGKYQSILRVLPAGANIAASIVASTVYGKIIDKFCEWEDYGSDEELLKVKAQRKFYLDAVLAYAPIILTAFFYMVLAQHGATMFLRYMHYNFGETLEQQGHHLPKHFNLNSDRLRGQAIFYTAKQQLIALVTMGLPVGVGWLKQTVLKKPAAGNVLTGEQLRSPFDSGKLASSVVIAFGYVLLLAPVWPLASLFTLLGLWLRSRGALIVLTNNSRVPPAFQSRSLGFWKTNLFSIACFSAVAGSAMSTLYGGANRPYVLAGIAGMETWAETLLVALISENALAIIVHVAEQVFSALL